ncbi:hypothetical protein Pan216_52500 [Planctomycetes bacterium Pan216]|uniref:Uncharacterized protein n=1 Tax=Kolteria novifilia TaxID=2527975 RepID=A0A518BBJ5_9BACT|nr:hypothetical protein Pan216_52500 [Planctomycetes bacterium Pan216]
MRRTWILSLIVIALPCGCTDADPQKFKAAFDAAQALEQADIVSFTSYRELFANEVLALESVTMTTSEKQILAILRQAETEMRLADICLDRCRSETSEEGRESCQEVAKELIASGSAILTRARFQLGGWLAF